MAPPLVPGRWDPGVRHTAQRKSGAPQRQPAGDARDHVRVLHADRRRG